MCFETNDLVSPPCSLFGPKVHICNHAIKKRRTEVYHKAMKMSRNMFVRSVLKSFFLKRGSNSIKETKCVFRQGLLYRWTEHSAYFSFSDFNWGRENGPQNYTAEVDILDHDLLQSHQDLSNEGSNFILSSLEVGHSAAQTQPFFDKLPEITDFAHLNTTTSE